MRAFLKVSSYFLVAILVVLPLAAQTTANISAAQKATPNITGDWQGTLEAGGQKLHLILHIAQAADGNFKATLDSVDQNANGIPISSMSLKDGKLVFAVDAVRGSYEGKLDAAATLIEGTWTQGEPLPLTFKRVVKKSNIDGDWLEPSLPDRENRFAERICADRRDDLSGCAGKNCKLDSATVNDSASVSGVNP